MTQVGARVSRQAVVRHGRNMILPVLLDAHAARRRLVKPMLSFLWPLSRGPIGVKSVWRCGRNLSSKSISSLRNIHFKIWPRVAETFCRDEKGTGLIMRLTENIACDHARLNRRERATPSIGATRERCFSTRSHERSQPYHEDCCSCKHGFVFFKDGPFFFARLGP